MLRDRFGRPLSDFRVSVNEACNLQCTYCHREGGAMVAGDMTADEIVELCDVAADLGCESLKITGGEPTLRPDTLDIVRRVAPRFRDVSMVTNGLSLEKMAGPLKDAGLHRVNVSMDSLDAARFREVTGGGDVEKVKRGIRAAVAAGLHPVKINMVVLRDFNLDDIPAMIGFARQEGVGLQLIELHTDRENAFGLDFKRRFVSLEGVEKDLAARAERVEVAPQHARPRYVLHEARRGHENGDGVPATKRTVVEVVRPYANEGFCAQCHRMRLTADGRLKPCLMRQDNYVDVLRPLRGGASRGEMVRLFVEANGRREPYWPASAEQLAKIKRGSPSALLPMAS